MKLLPCPRCGTAKGPAKIPVVIGRLSSPSLRFRCRGCGQSVVMTTADWNHLSECSPKEAEEALLAESGQGGLPPFRAHARAASGLLSPTAGKLVR